MPSIADFCRIGPGCVQGIIDVTILVGISYASFKSLQSQFLEDLSQALQIDHSQVRKLVGNVYICIYIRDLNLIRSILSFSSILSIF
jgi:hypothetical protein